MKQKHQVSLRKFSAAISILAVFVSLTLPMQTQAATLTTPRDYLNRQQADLSTGAQHDIFFTAATNVSGGAGTNKIIVLFPDADDTKWCRTNAGAVTALGITDPVGATESASALPGTLSATCSQGSGSGSAESNLDRIVITGVDNLTATTKYGVRLSGGSNILGTAAAASNNIKVTVKTNNGTTDVDTGTLAVSLIAADQIAVSALVDVTLSVSVDTTTAALGTLDTSSVHQAPVVTTVSTSAAGGYVSMVKYGATLTSGSDTIPDTAGGTIVAGTSEFGASSSDSGNTIGVWSPAACTNTASTSNATALSSSFKTYSTSTVAATNEATTLCFLASISGTQQPGSYTSTATIVTTAQF